MSFINPYANLSVPVNVQKLHHDFGNSQKREIVEPEEAFDLMLHKEITKNTRNLAPRPHTQAHFNQYNFVRAIQTFSVVNQQGGDADFSLMEGDEALSTNGQYMASLSSGSEFEKPPLQQGGDMKQGCGPPRSASYSPDKNTRDISVRKI